MQVVSQQLTVTEAAAHHGFSRRQLHRLPARYRDDGVDVVDPRSRRPNSPATGQDVAWVAADGER
ncbi:MAG: hypothetical protein JWO02_3091 [Solirubrobacterales bacterium]|nr:hypothetical protein [Solirubrobacterales bacterium]